MKYILPLLLLCGCTHSGSCAPKVVNVHAEGEGYEDCCKAVYGLYGAK